MVQQGREEAVLSRSRGIRTRKLVLTGMLACLAFVLNTFVYFPSMAPFQHFVDVVAAVLLGPWYGCAAAFLCGILRMLSGRTIQAVVGAVFGPVLGGLFCTGQNTHSVWAVLAGDHRYRRAGGNDSVSADEAVLRAERAISLLLYIPFYTPSAVVGGCMGVAVVPDL